MTIRRTFSFDEVEDHDLLVFLASTDNASEVVRIALREYRNGPSQLDLVTSFQALKGSIDELISVVRQGSFSRPVPNAKAEGNLDQMIGKWRTAGGA